MINNMEKTFVRVRSAKDIMKFVSLIILGLCSQVTPLTSTGIINTKQMAIVGVVVGVVGIVLAYLMLVLIGF